jgi:alkylation response protein AidB-like acyl-CoA dehydrogenase
MATTVLDRAHAPRVNSKDKVSPRPRPETPAQVVKSDAEAIEIAHRLAGKFSQGAALRDREGLLPLAELDAFSQSGLWGINVPKAYGGAGVSYVTLTEVIKIISAADPSLGQIPQNHLAIVEHISSDGTEAQKRVLFGEVLKGVRFGNAFSESGSKTVAAFETKITLSGEGYVVNGKKFYSTGALLSHIVPIVAVDDEGRPHLAFADRDSKGLEIVNDWSSFGQRTTASGTVIIDNVTSRPIGSSPPISPLPGRPRRGRSRRSFRRRSTPASPRERSRTRSALSRPAPGLGSTLDRSARATITSRLRPSGI